MEERSALLNVLYKAKASNLRYKRKRKSASDGKTAKAPMILLLTA